MQRANSGTQISAGMSCFFYDLCVFSIAFVTLAHVLGHVHAGETPGLVATPDSPFAAMRKHPLRTSPSPQDKTHGRSLPPGAALRPDMLHMAAAKRRQPSATPVVVRSSTRTATMPKIVLTRVPTGSPTRSPTRTPSATTRFPSSSPSARRQTGTAVPTVNFVRGRLPVLDSTPTPTVDALNQAPSSTVIDSGSTATSQAPTPSETPTKLITLAPTPSATALATPSAIAVGTLAPTPVPIKYHGGPLVLGPVNVYTIWYGNWSVGTGKEILSYLIENVGGHPWFDIARTYTDAKRRRFVNSMRLAGSMDDAAYSEGLKLDWWAVMRIVQRSISDKTFPLDPQGIVVVLLAPEVEEVAGMCGGYCGYHLKTTVQVDAVSADMPYAMIGNPSWCMDACTGQSNVSPNFNPSADGMASILLHELVEIITNPLLDAWFWDEDRSENADHCAWNYGDESDVYTLETGVIANMRVGTRNYLIQSNWVNAPIGYCAMQFPPRGGLSGRSVRREGRLEDLD